MQGSRWNPLAPFRWGWLLCCLLLLTGACTSTSIHGRKPEDLAPVTFRKIVVLGFFNSEKDRETFETHVAKALDERGCDAVGSLDDLDHGVQYTQEEMEERFEKQGYEAVLLLRVSDIQQVRTDIPENYYTPLDPYAYGWYSYWTDGVGVMIRGGYHERHDVVHMEGGLFSLETEKPLWFGQLETKRVRSIRELADSLGPALAKRLEKEGLIP